MTETCPISNIDEMLEALGVTADTLTADEKRSLDDNGYVLFKNLIDPAWLVQLRAAYDRIAEKEGAAAGLDYHQEAGALRIGNIVNKGAAFDRVYTHPKFLAAVHHIIGGEFRLSSISAREPLANFSGKQQGLHPDYWGDKHDANRPNQSADAAFMLDDFSPENGATRVVPGSHRWPTRPEKEMADTSADHPKQIVVSAPSGSVLVYNGHTWHSGTLNTSGRRRRALFPYMVAKQYSDGGAYQRSHLLKITYDRLSPAARYLLAVDA
jgi:ectoine hydroxylase-related dioxygenase (phytanoyl-CoA dioxygenase family)